MSRKETIAEMGELLKQRRDALRMAVRGDFSLLQKMRQETVGDLVDFAMDSSYDEINAQLAEVESRELASVELALDKVRAGTYGKCEACGKNIPLARLQALPYASLCVECQRLAEQNPPAAGGVIDWARLQDAPADDYSY